MLWYYHTSLAVLLFPWIVDLLIDNERLVVLLQSLISSLNRRKVLDLRPTTFLILITLLHHLHLLQF